MNQCQELGFFNSNFVYFPLPKKSTGVRFTSDLAIGSLTITSTTEVPFGLYARLALIAMTNLAFRSKENPVKSFTVYKLLHDLRWYKPSGLQLSKFANQLVNWSTTLITMMYRTEERTSVKNLVLIDSAEFKLEKDLENDMHVYLQFTDSGRDFLIESAFPIPLEALQKVKCAFDLDTLAWLISSVYQVSKTNTPRLINWENLYEQFAISQKNQSKFKTNFGSSLYEMKLNFYSDARVTRTPEGIQIFPSPLLTKERSSSCLMIPNLGGQQ